MRYRRWFVHFFANGPDGEKYSGHSTVITAGDFNLDCVVEQLVEKIKTRDMVINYLTVVDEWWEESF